MIILPMYDQDSTRFTNFVNSIKTKPSVILWNILLNANQSNISTLQSQKSKLMQLDGSSRISIAEFTETSPPFQYMLSDLEGSLFFHGPWEYPWAIPQSLDLSAYLFRDHAVMANAKGVFPMASVQTYNYENASFPPPAHLDAQSYLGINAGNKGILFYELRDVDNNVRISVTQPALYAQASKIAEEVLQSNLKNVFLNGTHAYFNPGPDIHFATWRYNNELYVIAVNSSITNSISVNIPILFIVVGQPQNFFTYRPDSLYLENGALKGELSAMQVAIYKFDVNELSVKSLENQRFNVYPNPVSNTFKVSGLVFQFSYEVYTLNGTLLQYEKNISTDQLIDIANLPKGIYLLNILQEAGSSKQTIKIIKD